MHIAHHHQLQLLSNTLLARVVCSPVSSAVQMLKDFLYLTARVLCQRLRFINKGARRWYTFAGRCIQHTTATLREVYAAAMISIAAVPMPRPSCLWRRRKFERCCGL
jgi:hypothetical protein